MSDDLSSDFALGLDTSRPDGVTMEVVPRAPEYHAYRVRIDATRVDELLNMLLEWRMKNPAAGGGG